MQIIGGQSNDPSLLVPLTGQASFSAGVAAVGGQVILHNLSTYDVLLNFGSSNDMNRQAILHAWQQRQFNFCGKATPLIYYSVPIAPASSSVATAPSSFIWGEAYAPGEDVPISLPNYDRLSNVGNTVATSGGSASLRSDGSAPGTLFIESTPSDQVSSSLDFDNDGSGFWQILSANVLRTVFNFVRGNNLTTKASLQIGDSGDTGIMTIYATLGAGSVVPLGTLQAGALPSGVTVPPGNITSGALPSGVTIGAPQVVAGQFPAGTNGGYTVASTNQAGTFQFVLNNSATSGQNSDMFALQRLVNQAQSWYLGIDSSGNLYWWDGTHNNLCFEVGPNQQGMQLPGGYIGGYSGAVLKVGNTAGGVGDIVLDAGSGNWVYLYSGSVADHTHMENDGLLYSVKAGLTYKYGVLASAGGGNAGARVWCGTTDPGSSASEGDIWIQG